MEDKKNGTQGKKVGRSSGDILLLVLLVCILLVAATRIFALLRPMLPIEPVSTTMPGIHATGPATAPTATQIPTYPPIETGKTDIRLNVYTRPVSLLTPAGKDYLAAEPVNDVTAFLTPYWETETRSDRGSPVELSYTIYALPTDVEVVEVLFRVYPRTNRDACQEYRPADGWRSVFVYNLCTGASYCYEVEFTLSDGTKFTLFDDFDTVLSPRLMNINGIVNVRDLGGWRTVDGQTVKQGLVYRGSEMDGAVEPTFRLTEEGLAQMQALGIRTDMDLRHDGQDILGPDVQHIFYNAIQYEHAFSAEGMEAIRKVFADLANPENYPVYLHCTYGADRTGTVCYLLLGLLGVSAEDMKRDYDLTALYYGHVSEMQMDPFIARIAELPGETTQQKVTHFLQTAGVTEEQMQKICEIFLG